MKKWISRLQFLYSQQWQIVPFSEHTGIHVYHSPVVESLFMTVETSHFWIGILSGWGYLSSVQNKLGHVWVCREPRDRYRQVEVYRTKARDFPQSAVSWNPFSSWNLWFSGSRNNSNPISIANIPGSVENHIYPHLHCTLKTKLFTNPISSI